LANTFQIAQDQRPWYTASFFTAVNNKKKQATGLHTVFPLPRTVAKRYDKENHQHQIYVQKSTVNAKHYKALLLSFQLLKGVFTEKGEEREILLKIAKIYTYEVKHLRQEQRY